MGTVYRGVRPATSKRSEEEAAIKIFAIGRTADPARLAGCMKEVQLAMTVRHENIVAVHKFGRLADGTLFLCMERVPGRDLRAVLTASRGQLSARRVILIGLQIGRALTALHAHGIAHRDVKPENVMVTPHGAHELVKLLDFSIARQVEDADGAASTGPGFGTVRYMAPERFLKGLRRTTACDVYALGILMFECLTAAHPLQAIENTREELARLHITEVPLSLQSLWPAAPAMLTQLLTAMLQKDPERRPSAQLVVLRLAELVSCVPDSVLHVQVEAVMPRSDSTEPPQAPGLSDFLVGTSHAEAMRLASRRTALALRHRPAWMLPIGVTAGFCSLLGVIGMAWNVRGARQAIRGDSRSPSARLEPLPSVPTGMVFIEGGYYTQGSSEKRMQEQLADCAAFEGNCQEEQFRRQQPQRSVEITSFYLDQTEVTVQAFATWLNSGSRRFVFKDGASDTLYLETERIASLHGPDSDLTWTVRGYESKPGTGDRPVRQVTWLGAHLYCADRGMRLPSEAQYEFVASRRGTTAYPWGDQIPRCQDAVAIAHPEDNACQPRALPGVGSNPQDRSPEGVFDLAGSVMEWTSDRFRFTYPPCAGCVDPVETDEPDTLSNPSLDRYFVIRGGSYDSSRVQARASFRTREAAGRVWTNVGFRCALPLSAHPQEPKP